jgi:hypothetical protein
MVNIHQHGGNHQNVGQFPVLAKKQAGDDCRNDKMQGEVYDLNCRALFAMAGHK